LVLFIDFHFLSSHEPGLIAPEGFFIIGIPDQIPEIGGGVRFKEYRPVGLPGHAVPMDDGCTVLSHLKLV
jgi:hypothetical protein